MLELVVDERDHDRLSTALMGMGAEAAAMPDRRPRWLAQTVQRSVLPHGTAVEVMGGAAGLPDYRQLAAGADRLTIGGAEQRVASVRDLIVMAEASHTVGARRFLTALYAVLDARRAGPPRHLERDSPEAHAALERWLTRTAA